jgi:glyoxylase-like metal-dependent hydrolase (beta-lactamase superfamily II)
MEIRPGLHRVQSINQVIYALDSGQGYVLVDVGDEKELDNKLAALKDDGIAPEQIAAVLITHFHDDHCGALAKLRALAHPKVVTHRLSIAPATLLPPIPRGLVDYTVDDGDTVEIGSLAFRVHHLPGHTHDSVVYQLPSASPSASDLFVGDLTFEWAGVGWMDIHWGSCLWQYKESLTKLLTLAPATLYPGHGGPCALSEASIYRAQNTLDILEKIDGSPLMIGQPAKKRGEGEGRETIRIAVPG